MAEPMSLTLGGVIYAGAILAGNQSVQEALTNTVLNLGTGICLEAITGRKSSRLEALNYWRKQCAKPDNHDIEKAVYRSHLMACRLLLEQQLEKDKHKSVWSAKTKPALEKLKVIFDKDIRTTKKKNWRIPSENDQPHLFATDTIHDSLSSHSDRNSKLNTSLVDIAITDVLRRFTPDLPEYSHEAERLLKAWLEIQFHDVNQGYIKAIGYFIADEIKHGDDAFIRIFMAAESIEMRKDLVHLTELVSNALTVTIDLKVLAHFEQIHHSILQQLKQLQADVGEISEGVGNANLGIEKILETIEPVNAQPNSLLLPLPLKRTARTYEPELMQKLMADLTSGEAHLARVCVRGVGGIGKSTLVETIFHRLYDQGAFNHYLFVYADKGVTATLVELAEQFKINVTHDDWQKKLAIKLATLGPSMLVAIDNLQNLQINDANPLLNLPGAIVVSSREKVPGLSTKDYKGLSETDCIALYRQHNEDESDIESIRLLVELTAHHTLAIELLAKQAAASILSASALYQTIKEKGFNLSEVYSEPVFAQQGEGEYINEQIFKHFEILFDLSQLKPEDKKSLGLIALLGAQPCTAQYFKTALSLADFTGLNTLAQLGWVQRSNLDQSIAFSVHPIIQGVVLENAFPATNDVNILLENIFLLANEAYNQGRYADAERELRAIWAIRRRPE
ncbi:MAG: hypothetical protein HWE26_21280, partial [Alteromonadaceae bacterium]|nr:hypothetical protein [Alteromonadaceae bacterium]